jgi:endonuclease/exonuclease/phosphatase family metal-dependent hydrolase
MSPGERAARPAGAARRIVLASYNVHRCVGTDRRRDVARVLRVLRELRADVIALQEADEHLDDPSVLEHEGVLAELSGLRGIALPPPGAGYGHHRNLLLTSLPLRRVDGIELSYPRREPRGALDVELDAGHVGLRVIATHLGLRPAERRYQVRKILASATHDERAIIVLLGDFNEWWIAGRPLRWLHAHFGFTPHLRTFPSSFPLFALDRIWAHPPTALVRVWRHLSPESRVASDHLPILGELRF